MVHIQRGSGAFFIVNAVCRFTVADQNTGVNILKKQTKELKIMVKQGTTVHFIEAKDVIYIESIGRKVILHFMDSTTEYYDTLKSLSETLQPGFYRIHRAYLINLSHIKYYTKREVHMSNGETVLISKYRLPEFRKMLEEKYSHLIQ